MKRASMIVALGLLGVLACGADGDSTGAGTAPCDQGRQLCDKACVDVRSDARNCGACGAVCADGQHCSAGACVCDDSQALCPTSAGLRCVDVSSSASDCGACGRTCQNAESCLAGTCICIGEAIECGGACIDPRSDAKFCGATAGCGDNGKGKKGDACTSTQLCETGACTPCMDFTLGGYVDVSPGANGLGVGDFNGDGKADLAVLGYPSFAVDILLGHGDGTFSLVQRFPPNPSGLTGITVADVDGDGHPDLVSAGVGQDASFNTFGIVDIFYGSGDGTFATIPKQVARAVNKGVNGIAIADMDKDGRKDLVILDPVLPGFAVARATGARTYAAFVDTATSASGSPPSSSFTIGDVDGNGQLDVVVSTSGLGSALPSSIDVVLRAGASWAPRKTFATGRSSEQVSLADLNGDGKVDAMTADGFGLSLLFGNGDGTFAPASTLLTYGFSSEVVPVDLDGDKVVDLVIGKVLPVGGDVSPYSHIGQVEVRVGIGNGTFYAPISFEAGAGAFVVADVNGDGRPDILTTSGDNELDGKVSVYLNSKRVGCP